MERVKRRWWTRGVSVLAALVILSAVISGLFQIAVLTLPSYRADLSAWVTEVANRPVQIGGVNLGWRGLAPRLDLDDITLYSDDGNESLTLDRLSLGFSLLRLITGDVFPYRLEVSGLHLLAERDAAGQWQVAGFASDDGSKLTPAQREAIARDLARFKRVTLRKSTLVIREPTFAAQPQELRIGRLDVERAGRGVDVEGRLILPAAYGERIDFSAELEGRLADLQSWSGDFEAELQNLRPQGWLQNLLQPGVQIAAAELGLALEGRIAKGQLQSASLDAESANLAVARAGRASLAEDSRLRGTLRHENGGWTAELQELSLDDERLARGTLRWRRGGDGGSAVDIDAGELRLTRLMPWLTVWRDAPAALAQADRVSGRVQNLVLRLRRTPDSAAGPTTRYSLTAQIDELALADRGRFGFAQLRGALSANENGGTLRLDDSPLQLIAPGTFAQPLQLDALSTQLQWKRLADGWRLSSPELRWRALGGSGSGRVLLERPDDPERSTWLDLAMRFALDDMLAAKPYAPKHWPESLRQWLQRAVQKGRISAGTLNVRGPLRDFPYHRRGTGEWSLDFDISGARLAFAPDWPALERVAAHLAFRGNGLDLNAQSGSIGGVPIEAASARFEDFSSGQLRVEARARDDLADFYSLLRASPLHRRFAGLLDHTRAAGPAELEIGLDIPLRDTHATQAQGLIAIDDAQLFYQGLESPLSGIGGTLQFDARGVQGSDLVARFEELPLVLRIEPRAQTQGVVIAEFALAPNADGQGASRYIPGFLRTQLSGVSRWRAELPIRDRDVALTLASDLSGTALDLPEPLGKPAETARPVVLRIGGDAAAPLRIGLNYDATLAADLAFASEAAAEGGAATLKLQGLRARFGGEAPKAEKNVFIVDGRAGTMDASAWIAFLTRDSGGSDSPRIEIHDLDIAHLRWRDQLSGATRLRYQAQANGWRATLSGEGAQGQVDWSGPAPGRLQARLEHLRLTPQPPPPREDGAPPPADDKHPPTDPARLPEFDVRVERVQSENTALGRLLLRSARIANGQKLEQLELKGGIVDFSAGGQWRRVEGRSSAELRYQFSSADIEAVLKALAYAPNLAAARSESNGELKWSPSPTGLFWHAANGRVNLVADDGQLRPVKPGASRVLGLINFFTLPRRLTLNFSDVVDEGLGFDTVRGHFDLGNGAALTDDLNIEGPSLRMEVRGRIGLAARDYDQRVAVYPGVSSGVTLGAALLGGPAVGALVLLAQELLDKPLDQVSQLTYHVSGTWDNPKVERGEVRSAPPAPGGRKR